MRTPEGTALRENSSAQSPTVLSQGTLRFWSHTAFFRLETSRYCGIAGVELGKEPKRFSVVDNKNDWCGTLVVVKSGQLLADLGITVELVALRESHCQEQPRDPRKKMTT